MKQESAEKVLKDLDSTLQCLLEDSHPEDEAILGPSAWSYISGRVNAIEEIMTIIGIYKSQFEESEEEV